ncbi:MAG: PepSY domain-containing protein [Thiobacillaceae bacterium]
MNRHGLARFIRRWHARLGVAAALVFIVLIVTGLALNHTEQLGLAHRSIQSESLSHWYGLPPPRLLAVYEADGQFVATPDAWLYRNLRLPGNGGIVVGAVRTPAMLAIATAQSVSLFTPTGEMIDTLRGAALPHQPITALGQIGDRIVVQTQQGDFSSADGLDWQTVSGNAVIWSHNQPTDPKTIARISQQLAPALPIERVVLDLHSGRLFGHYGPFFVDAAALVLLALSLSGIWIQWRSWHQKRLHPRHH